MWQFYRTTFGAPENPSSRGRTLLHFGAVDWQATVYVNGRQVANHTGGYDSFTIDITDFLLEPRQAPGRPDNENELMVAVYDPSDQGPQPMGKQKIGAIKRPVSLP